MDKEEVTEQPTRGRQTADKLLRHTLLLASGSAESQQSDLKKEQKHQNSSAVCTHVHGGPSVRSKGGPVDTL